MKTKYFLLVGLSLFSLLTGCNSKPEKGDQGIQGEQGEKGDKGDTGEAGKDGSKIYTGEGVPNDNTGVEGDLYIDTTTWNLYTKGSDKWSLTGNIKGDTGSSGVSVTNTYIDDDGNLICELSNGQTVNAGKVKDTTKHTVNFYFKDSIIETKEVVSGSKITPPDSSLIPEGYTVTGWYINEYGMKSPWTFNGCVVTSNLDLYANYSLNEYSITYNLDGGSLSNQVTSYTIEDEVTLGTPTKEGYIFRGWTGSNGDTPVVNYVQPKGSTGDKNYTANFISDEQAESLGMKPKIDLTANTLTYGLYPQTHVGDTTITTELDKLTTTESNGWYLYNGSYYAKLTAHPYSADACNFEDGTAFTSDTSYWFKCELITWKILTTTDNEYTLLSNTLLDAHRYNQSYTGTKSLTDYNGETDTVYANNYKYSEIRTWLNTSFYNSAFALNNSYIQTAEVDNSGATTNSSSNTYACNNTNDKVYLPSYQDYRNTSYGFTSNEARYCKTTDYARVNGAKYSTKSAYLYNGPYWTRSPYSENSYIAYRVNGDGAFFSGVGNSVSETYVSVRPAITIKVS